MRQLISTKPEESLKNGHMTLIYLQVSAKKVVLHFIVITNTDITEYKWVDFSNVPYIYRFSLSRNISSVLHLT